jgi:transposase InsO family protein
LRFDDVALSRQPCHHPPRAIIGPRQVLPVWCVDVTYIPMAKGFLYLVVVIDWVSRAVLAWRLSNTLGAEFCVEALKRPPKTPDRVYPVVKNQEYDRVYDWEYRPG